ncbi:hypothetical protein N9N08_01120 [bacterium]|jgi:hypothetical protein|nr:hypothetical protein [bacterium]
MKEIRLGSQTYITVVFDNPELKKGQELIKGNMSSDIDVFSKSKLKQLMSDELSEYKDSLLCLSGGYDSQFLALSMIEFGYKFDTVIYESLWDNNVVNANDVLFAEKFCKKYNLPYKIISIDAKDFFENTKMLSMVKKYRVYSPQILFHIHFLNTLDTDKILLGGDPPWITYGQGKTSGTRQIDYLYKYFVPYQIYADETKTKMMKSIFHQSPDLFHLGLTNNIDILEKQKVYQSSNDNIVYEKYRYKEIFYNNILEIPLEHRLMTATGFENLKKHYASITGRYDEFDARYRMPLVEIINRNNIYCYGGYNLNPPIVKIKYNPNCNEKHLRQKFNEIIDNIDASAIKDYLFDF